MRNATWVRLDPVDRSHAEAHAQIRHTKAASVDDKAIQRNADSMKLDVVGAIGEIAIARYLGLRDANTYQGSAGDDGADLEWRGLRVEVKTTETRASDPCLILPDYKIKPIRNGRKRAPDVLVFVVIVDDVPHVAGWTQWGAFVMRHRGWCRGGRTPGRPQHGRHLIHRRDECALQDWAMPASDLYPANNLIAGMEWLSSRRRS